MRLCATLTAAADKYARLMAQKKHYGHIGPDGSTPEDRAQEAGYSGEWFIVGENIAAGHPNVSSVMKGWVNSPGHYENMVTASFTDVGFGFAQGRPKDKFDSYWVQKFGVAGVCGN